MIITKENERVYLTAWEYNASRIFTELAKIVTDQGGKVKPTKTAIISNRQLTAAVHDLTEKINGIENAIVEYGTNENRENALVNYKSQLEKLQAVNNDPITVTHTSYITFILNGLYYYYQVNDNPFFEFYYQKTPVNNNQYSGDSCLEEDKKEWLYDCFFKSDCSQEDIKEGANLIFNMLCNARNSVIRRDCKKTRVPNTYNDGWHYENVYEPERLKKIDF